MTTRAPTVAGPNLCKVVIALPEDAPTPEETLWAERLGEQLYRLDNAPWYARGCALDDLVQCHEDAGRLPRFVRVVRPSGNRTLRIYVPNTAERQATKKELFEWLAQADCPFEEYAASAGLIAVTIPSFVEAGPLLERLAALEADGRAHWESGNF